MNALEVRQEAATVQQITSDVTHLIGPVPASFVRSYLRLDTPTLFARTERAQYSLSEFERPAEVRPATPRAPERFLDGRAALNLEDCLTWLDKRSPNSVHAVVTDPPYGLIEYSSVEQDKLRAGKGGVLLSHLVSGALTRGGLERRGEIVRLVMIMRGGDRPKAAHVEFSDVSVMPRSMWEPWLMFRKPVEGRVQDNLRHWGTGGFRRISDDQPFGDVIESAPTCASERQYAPHPSLKPQAFLRKLVRGVLPLGKGIVLDPFAGSASTLAAAEAVGYESIGVERDKAYFELAKTALPALARLQVA